MDESIKCFLKGLKFRIFVRVQKDAKLASFFMILNQI